MIGPNSSVIVVKEGDRKLRPLRIRQFVDGRSRDFEIVEHRSLILIVKSSDGELLQLFTPRSLNSILDLIVEQNGAQATIGRTIRGSMVKDRPSTMMWKVL